VCVCVCVCVCVWERERERERWIIIGYNKLFLVHGIHFLHFRNNYSFHFHRRWNKLFHYPWKWTLVQSETHKLLKTYKNRVKWGLIAELTQSCHTHLECEISHLVTHKIWTTVWWKVHNILKKKIYMKTGWWK